MKTNKQTNKQTCPCATDYQVMLRFRTWWRRWDTCYFDGHLAEQTDTKIPQEQEVRIPHAVHYWKPGVGQVSLFHRCQLIHGSQPHDHCWRSRKHTRTDSQVPLTILCNLVKQHPPLWMYLHSLSSHVRYFIHITVSSTLRLTYIT